MSEKSNVFLTFGVIRVISDWDLSSKEADLVGLGLPVSSVCFALNLLVPGLIWDAILNLKLFS